MNNTEFIILVSHISTECLVMFLIYFHVKSQRPPFRVS